MKIEIIIAAKGETSLQTKGFAGSSCRDASKFIEEALGKRLDETLTAEFHQAMSVEHLTQVTELSKEFLGFRGLAARKSFSVG